MDAKLLRFARESLPDKSDPNICYAILRGMVGESLTICPDDILHGIRGLFWSHPALSLTTLYFPASPMVLSSAGTRDSGMLIVRAMEGPLVVGHKQRSAQASKGEVVFLPANAPLSMNLPEGGRFDCAHLPGHALGRKGHRPALPLLRPIPGESLPLQLLITYAGFLLQRDGQSEADADMLVEHFYDLLRVFAESVDEAGSRGGGADRLGSAKARIEDYLHDSTFSIADVARMEGVTPRSIQKLFASEGSTFSAYLLDRRLDLSRSTILTGELLKPITQIALDMGFDDPSYFSRAFRKRYGVTPRDLRRSIAAG